MATRSGYCSLQANWWLFALRGVLALIFGGLALWMPAVAVLVYTIIFGAFSLVDGVFFLVSGIHRAREGEHWGSLAFSGVLGIIVGLIVLIVPQIAAISLTAFLWAMIALWSISTGILVIRAAIRLRREIEGEWLLGLSGVLSVLLGVALIVLFLMNPIASLVTLGLLIGIYALISGVVLLWLAYKLREREHAASPNMKDARAASA